MKTITLQHWSSEERRTIGIYSDHQAAMDAIERLKDKPGFRDNPQMGNLDGETDYGFYTWGYDEEDYDRYYWHWKENEDQYPEGF